MGAPTIPGGSRTAAQRAAVLVATAGGVGYAPIAPGTVASALTALALWLASPTRSTAALVVVITALAGAWAAQHAERALGGKDPGAIVVDEVAGMALSVAALPPRPDVLVAGFLLFRFFDILKPYPANALQRLRGGAGVMLDDLVAGLYALLVLVAARAVVGWP